MDSRDKTGRDQFPIADYYKAPVADIIGCVKNPTSSIGIHCRVFINVFLQDTVSGLEQYLVVFHYRVKAKSGLLLLL